MKFDVIVIGGGPGGYVCAIRAAQLGFKTACVEEMKTLGGTCLNVGCIPSKAMLESSHHYHNVLHDFKNHGINATGVSLDLAKMLARKDTVVKGITGGVDFLFKKNKITWIKGHGSLTKDRKVLVHGSDGEQSFEADHIVIATGSVPIELPSAPFDHDLVVDSTDALSFFSVPEHLVVVGGGVIGMELGSVWARLGAKVTVIEALGSILGAVDGAVAQTMLKIFQKQGISFHLKCFLEKVEKIGGKVKVTFRKEDGTHESVEGNRVLVSVGRRACTKNLGLELLGIELDKGGRVVVDDHFRTNIPGVYAVGDVIKGPMLAHKAEEEGVALAEMLAGKHGHVNYEAIPNVVYTWPEVATIGMSEEACKEKGVAYKVGKFFFKANGRAKAMGCDDGFVKFCADAKTDRLLGVHIVGPLASELIAELAIAFEFGASAEDIARSVHAHPTLAEVIKEAALDVDGRAIHG